MNQFVYMHIECLLKEKLSEQNLMKYNRHENRMNSNIFGRIRTCRVIQMGNSKHIIKYLSL
jgi:hypothetical protein